MTDPSQLQGVAALYRRFRPGRFAELRGQDHVVRALTGAVANGRVVHAYLFSGPRGTGKTTTARILAKALNCESPDGGDACNLCASCVSITRGSSLDVLELDAATNNGVDDIRELTVGAWHGSPGRWKVYIIDEVHMLSKGAEAAFLKTLEEPPQHVVFVLATTEPHRVVSTIRSRTQHLEFRLLAAETLRGLVTDVAAAAHIAVDSATVAAAVRLGQGSARDALSALDQVVATGSVGDVAPPFDDLLAALAAPDAVAVLTALAELARLGWDPEQIAENLAAELRQIFLLLVAPQSSDALDVERERLTSWGQRLSLARTVRALEIVGKSLREMKGSPVPAVTLEVALVRFTHPELDDSIAALDERLTRLERSGPPVAAAPAPPSAPSRPIPNLSRTAGSTTAPAPAPAPEPSAPTGFPSVEVEEFARRFSASVLPRLPRSAQIFLATSAVHSVHGAVVTLTVPSEGMRANAEKFQSGLRSAIEHEFKAPYQLAWVVADAPAPVREPRSAPPVPDGGDVLDDREIAESEQLNVDSVAGMLITEAFPGAEEIA